MTIPHAFVTPGSCYQPRSRLIHLSQQTVKFRHQVFDGRVIDAYLSLLKSFELLLPNSTGFFHLVFSENDEIEAEVQGRVEQQKIHVTFPTANNSTKTTAEAGLIPAPGDINVKMATPPVAVPPGNDGNDIGNNVGNNNIGECCCEAAEGPPCGEASCESFIKMHSKADDVTMKSHVTADVGDDVIIAPATSDVTTDNDNKDDAECDAIGNM